MEKSVFPLTTEQGSPRHEKSGVHPQNKEDRGQPAKREVGELPKTWGVGSLKLLAESLDLSSAQQQPCQSLRNRLVGRSGPSRRAPMPSCFGRAE